MKPKTISKFLAVVMLVAIVAMAVSVNVSAGGSCGSNGTETNPNGAGGIAQNSVKEGTFYVYQGEIQYENAKPVIRLFTTTWCPHCIWIKETFDDVVNEYVQNGEIIAYHWEIDTGDNTLTAKVETNVPQSEMTIYRTFNPRGSIPTYVFGEKYWRIGNGYERTNDLSAEEYEFRIIIETLIRNGDASQVSVEKIKPDFVNIEVAEARDLIDSNSDLVIIDVRSPLEFEFGHISNAISIPLYELTQRINELNKDDTILVYCRRGTKSEEASRILAQNGFDNVHNMLGGIDAWSFAGYEVVTTPTEEPEIVNDEQEDVIEEDTRFTIITEETKASNNDFANIVFFAFLIVGLMALVCTRFMISSKLSKKEDDSTKDQRRTINLTRFLGGFFGILLLLAVFAVAMPGVVVAEAVDNDGDGYTSDIDCDDSDPQKFPGQVWYADCDGDSYYRSNVILDVVDTVNDFSGIQGQYSFTYGSYPASSPGSFTQLPSYDSGGPKWHGYQSFNTPFIDASGGHPGVDDAQWAVRRWTSGYSGTVEISGEFYDRDTSCGDGQHVRIYHNSDQIFEYLNVPSSSTTYGGLSVSIDVGDTIDFVIDPISSTGCESTQFTGVITVYSVITSCDLAGADAQTPCSDGQSPDGGWSHAEGDDCIDEDSTVFPGAIDSCDGIDNDCNGVIDDSNSCDDGVFCNGAEVCVAGVCQDGQPPCDDSIGCTLDTCDEASDSCTYTPDDSQCDDGLACTIDVCDATGGCENTVMPGYCVIEGLCYGDGDTDPSNACQMCNPSISQVSWSYKTAGTLCDDGDPSTTNDACNGVGTCVGDYEVICGNGIVEVGEECDDGNTGNGDGCSATCTLEVTDTDGDGINDDVDNCPNDPNTDQADSDGDGIGDVCETDYTGTWILDPTIDYYCASGLVDMSFSSVDITDQGSTLSVDTGSSPGVLTGDFSSRPDFSVTNTLPGGCTETYTLSGSFTDINTFTGTFEADYSGSCLDCSNQIFSVTGTRFVDSDDDGVGDNVDNCPDTYNPDQADSDGDGLGDACELICPTGYDDCNLEPSDGCEIDIMTDPDNCGACGNDCGNYVCDEGSCITTCLSDSEVHVSSILFLGTQFVLFLVLLIRIVTTVYIAMVWKLVQLVIVRQEHHHAMTGFCVPKTHVMKQPVVLIHQMILSAMMD